MEKAAHGGEGEGLGNNIRQDTEELSEAQPVAHATALHNGTW